MKRPVQLQSLFRNISQDYEIFPRLEIKGPESADDVTAGIWTGAVPQHGVMAAGRQSNIRSVEVELKSNCICN